MFLLSVIEKFIDRLETKITDVDPMCTFKIWQLKAATMQVAIKTQKVIV